jgi:hypothetical protein
VWPDKIKTLSDIMNKQKDFYYRDEEDYHRGHSNSYAKSMAEYDKKFPVIKWEREEIVKNHHKRIGKFCEETEEIEKRSRKRDELEGQGFQFGDSENF